MRTRTVRVDYLARVEGEGAFHIKVKDNRVVDSKFRIFEPPRFFEAFLRGRRFEEAPDITARICGICPIAYQSSSVQAMEEICGVKVAGPLRDLRRLIYCGEWIESHVLHVYMLHLPDFLGYEDAIRLAKDHPDAVKRGLRLKKLGNDLVRVLGGREIHPINMRVGGFYRTPSRKEFETFLPELEWAREAALETIRLVSALEFPKFERDYEFVSLRHGDEYPMNEGRLVSNKGLDIPLSEYFDHFEERHVSHSNALQSVLKARGAYHVGPLARYNLNFDRLFPSVQQAARDAGLAETCRNPFQSIIVRSVETLQAVEEAVRIIEGYQPPETPAVRVQPREGVGHGCTEAPRGICFHRYRIDSKGIIRDARIIPPTSQNQVTIEEDLLDLVSTKLALPQEKLTWLCEQAIRNYDPCISCATHFLKLTVEQVT
ncbi:MAG: Ni/Fe hydrogenase subunit alpha [Candidatus Omnitrophica bacterium]|nr:Ni/Fe hydrogenase subunit alpha [Candidatus Omnitrophota bacterium]